MKDTISKTMGLVRIQSNVLLNKLYPTKPIMAQKKNKNRKDKLVTTKLNSSVSKSKAEKNLDDHNMIEIMASLFDEQYIMKCSIP